MLRDGALAQRSAIEWVMRGVLATVVAIVGYVCVTNSLAQVMVKGNVELAHEFAPYDGRITALMAASLTGPEATERDRRRADQLAREALRRDPTAVLAVSTLGINAQIRGDTATARRLFAYSQELSRRDLQTQLWAIEDAVERGDIAGALRHYDIALRINPDVAKLLFPVLASATVDPAIRVALVKTLAGKPAWSGGFIEYLAGNGPDPQSIARLFISLRRVGVAVSETAHAGAVNALIAGGFGNDAWAYYASIRSGVDRRMSRDPRFNTGIEAPSPFDWASINEAGMTTSIQRGDQGGVFDFIAPAGISGPLLQQLQMLPPGDYRIEGHSIGINQTERALPYWLLSCRDGRELGRVTLSNSAQANGNFAGRFSVPAGCPVQTLVLVARPSDAVAGLSGQIDRIQLSPIQ